MTEIVEKTLILGFSLTVLVILFSFLIPIVSLISETTITMQLQNLTFQLDSGIKNAVRSSDNRSIDEGFSNIELEIQKIELEEKTQLVINYLDINETILVGYMVELNYNTVKGHYILNFAYLYALNTISINITNFK